VSDDVAELRLAAARMRDLAEPRQRQRPWRAVQLSGSNWCVEGVDGEIFLYGSSWLCAHVAAVGPLVTVALADWLDKEARFAAETGEGTYCKAEALAVARAFLDGAP
jgi:hypothetical protein